MNAIRFLAVVAASAAVACNTNHNAMNDLQPTNSLTDAEKRAGIMTPEVMWKIARVGDADLAFSPDGERVLYTLTTCDVAANRTATSLWTVSVAGASAPAGRGGRPSRPGLTAYATQALAVPSSAPASPAPNDTNPRWLPDGRIIFISDRSGGPRLWVMNGDGTNSRRVECVDREGSGGGPGVSEADREGSGADQDVESFGVDPTGRHIFVVRRVKVEKHLSADLFPDLPLSRARVYDDLMARHWSYWNDGSFSHIFVGELSEGKVSGLRDIMRDEPWDSPLAPYFDASEIAWNYDGTQLAYTCKKLTGAAYAVSTDSDIYLYDVASGATRNLTAGMPGYERYPRFSPDGRRVAFTSMARPGNESDKARLMVLDLAPGASILGASGAMVDLTGGFDYSAENITWAADGRIYFLAAVEGTVQLFSVSGNAHGEPTPSRVPSSLLGWPRREGGRRSQLACTTSRTDRRSGDHGEANSSAAAYSIRPLTSGDADIVGYAVSGVDPSKIVVARQSISRPTELYLLGDRAYGHTWSGTEPLTRHNDEFYRYIAMGRVAKRWVETTDHRQMLTWVVYPPGFDSTKRYPVLLYCQGGPQSTVSQFWSYRWNFQLMAAQGYVVVAPNRRGVPSFGQEWLDQISGDYAGQNIRDYLSAIDDVAREPWADRGRMGCVGASYGGYSVFYLAGHHGGRFKAFIAHCGIFNLESMYGQTEEMWFVNRDYGGPYWERANATAQRTYANSPHKFVDRWNTPILITTGEKDYRIPSAQSLEAFTAARLRGVPARLVVFEDEGHWVSKPQNSLAWNREFFGWLDKYLGVGPAGSNGGRVEK